MTNYEARLKRIMDAAALKEPDRVPCCPVNQTFPILHAGHTMAEVLYDFDKGAEAYIKYAEQFEPDLVWGHHWIHMGMGPMFELMDPKIIQWAGQPGSILHENSIHQWIEFAVLEDDEMDMFGQDYTGWVLEKGFPKTIGLLEPLGKMGLSRMNPGYLGVPQLAQGFSSPEAKEMITKLWKIHDLNSEIMGKTAALDSKLEEMGYPVLMNGFAVVPFDNYSDNFRGTIDTMFDLTDRREIVQKYNEMNLPQTYAQVEMFSKIFPGRFCFMPLHKGMDKFMSDKDYGELYWKDLQAIILHIIKCGMVPYIYTEGPYTSRLEFLKDVPPGKVIYHFEECDMLLAKKVLGDVACIAGGFNVTMLNFASKQQVIDEVKRLIDGCAQGGGYIFETSCGMDEVKIENIEAMFETVKTYGKY